MEDLPHSSYINYYSVFLSYMAETSSTQQALNMLMWWCLNYMKALMPHWLWGWFIRSCWIWALYLVTPFEAGHEQLMEKGHALIVLAGIKCSQKWMSQKWLSAAVQKNSTYALLHTNTNGSTSETQTMKKYQNQIFTQLRVKTTLINH